ncbi:MAG: gliding motility protein GldN [Bacteroidaceae bacterium]|nr:gliding motility protein GldN [Bacteroidaceae bacterium]
MAQPAKRRSQTTTTANASATPAKKATTEKKATAEKKADRAALMFPTSAEMPEDVVWRRDIYRQLDLLTDKNAPLYYPVEPHGKEQNLFTFVFRLWLSGRINVYNYKIDGNESFDVKDKADVKELLERYRIYYEEENGKVTVPESDIPSAQVTRYYIKESVYFDQRSAIYKARVTAFCPVLMEGDEFASIDESSTSKTPKPLFWVKYDDVASYLSRLPLMASNLNNVTNMTADDYFTLNRYDGKIYKTNNMQGRVLANYAQGDSAMAVEQARIEKQLTDFEDNIWHSPETRVDSAALLAAARADSVKVTKSKSRATRRKSSDNDSRRAQASEAAASKKREKTSNVSGSGAPRVSARRQRR